MEIERKFLIKDLPKNLEDYEKIHIEQGYLNTSSAPALRIRKYNQEYILCYKFKMKTQEKIASVCKEIELPLTQQAYQHLKTKIDGRMIEKNRYLVPLKDELTAEIDIFEGFLKGLEVVEVEFKSEQDASKFSPPDWFGKDVTLDVRFKNAHLCKISDVAEILNNLENKNEEEKTCEGK